MFPSAAAHRGRSFIPIVLLLKRNLRECFSHSDRFQRAGGRWVSGCLSLVGPFRAVRR